MRLEQRFVVDAPIDRVWALVMSPLEVGACIPGCETVEVLVPDRCRAVVAVRVGPVSARFALEIEIVERREPCGADFVTRGDEGGRASRLSARSTLTLSAMDPQRTEVGYTSDIALAGRLATVGLGLVRGKARALGEDFAQSMRARIGTAVT